MFLNIYSSGEHLVAYPASNSDSSVNEHVPSKCGVLSEALPADLALVWSFSGVRSHVCSKRDIASKRQVTKFALKRFLSRMRSEVFLEPQTGCVCIRCKKSR